MNWDDSLDSEFADITIPHKDSMILGATAPLEGKALSSTQQISITSLVDELDPHSLTEALMTLVPPLSLKNAVKGIVLFSTCPKCVSRSNSGIKATSPLGALIISSIIVQPLTLQNTMRLNWVYRAFMLKLAMKTRRTGFRI
jgi:hypothetical protein